ncbi:thiamine pyrophosphate-binding protein [Thermoactinomyces daqus]|uniref:Thiamine pyrophosphate-binding protein n=1 Tax=Thermoactinomyces daqus TaxID=1329516 RepID=A0A7W2AIE6_9BACL|nr:thiamine pyrophosphate-binding protein [Thermoactinomyces daqus]MBA4542788.1 thiamine pyrophosphate-binding protein [Thermoactinomyces daqus]
MGIHVAGHLLKQLDIWGCQRIYGVIGDANLDLLGELAKQSGVNYIACRTEMGAALMASAEAKLTGRPGVVLATSGPGIVSLLNGLADAAADGVPVLAITGQVERSKLGTGSKQEIDQQRLIEPIALFSALVADGKGFSTQLNLAFKAAVNRGGVAHLSIPKEMWREATDEIFYPNPPLMPPLQPQPEVMAELLSRLGQSTRPVFLVGRGIAGAEEKVIRLAETVQAAIIATMPAKSLIPNDHPLFAGGLGQAGSQSATDLLQMADLCVILGATWWPQAFVPQKIPVIQVDRIPENIGRTRPCVTSVVGDVSYVVEVCLQEMPQKDQAEWMELIQKRKQSWQKRIEEETSPSAGMLTPARLMSALGTLVDPRAVIVLDVGDHTLWFERTFPLKQQEILISGKWRTLGFALPAAIAAALNHPGRQVIAIVGDGGFPVTMAELATAAARRLPIKLVLLNNGCYAMEKNRMKSAGLHTLGADLDNPDFVRLAESFGFSGYRIQKEQDLPLLKEMIAIDQPALAEVICADGMLPHTRI